MWESRGANGLMGTPKPLLTGSFRIEIQTAALEGVWSSKTRPPSPVYLKELCTRRDLPATFEKTVKSRLLILWTGETSNRVTCREDVLNMVRRLGLRLGILGKALGKEIADSLWAHNAPGEGSRRDQATGANEVRNLTCIGGGGGTQINGGGPTGAPGR